MLGLAGVATLHPIAGSVISKLGGTPKRVTVLNGTGQVALSFPNDQHMRMHLIRSDGNWEVQGVGPIARGTDR